MSDEVSFWPEAKDPWEALGMGGRAGRGREQGPSGPETHTSLVHAPSDLFVVAPGLGGHVLYRAGDLIMPPYAGLPQVPAVWVNGVLVPG